MIDADALIELWKGCVFKGDITPIIENAPTIESERKRGKWFLTDTMYACNQCHSVFYETSPFCPNCGADMRGEKDG